MKKHTSNGTTAARTHNSMLDDVLYSSALYSRHGKTVAGIALSLAGATFAHDAYANPTDAHVASGDIKITNPTAKDLVVTQSSNKAVINWGSFNINSDESTRFAQPNSNSVTLNRITNGNASQILGKLDANGKVMIVNPNGVFFGTGAQVNVGGLVASTANISDDNFNAGNYKFDQAGDPNASIINQGNITASQGGLVALVAPNVRNDGTIAASMGTVALGAGSTATIDLYGDNLINFQVDSATGANITNNGTIKSGTVLMTANDANQLVNNVINNTGIIDASSAHEDGGSIVLDGGNGAVNLTGTLDVSGVHGGQVSVTGGEVTVDTGATINATGTNGGGMVKIGGDYQGGGTLKHAQKVNVKEGSSIDASATDNGNGGTVVLWSDAQTDFAGNIKANAGANGGNGGLIETSSQGLLNPTGTISASAAHGDAGTWLLDPSDINIGTLNINESGAPNYQPTGSFSSVKASDIQTALNAGTNVSVKTTSSGSGSGDINVLNSINSSGAGNLTLSAYHDVHFNAGVSITTQGGGVTIGADNTAKHSGVVSFFGSNSITTNGGNITIGGGLNPTTDFAYGGNTATSVSRDYQFDGYNPIYNTVGTAGVAFGQGTTINSGAGNIIINGHGGTAGYSNTGIYMEDTTIKSTTGNITIKGTAGDGNGAGAIENVTKDQGIVLAGNALTTIITTVDGAININGTGGINGVGSNETGIMNYGQISATGNGSVTLTGTGGGKGSHSDNNYGIWNAGVVFTQNGDLTANGQGGGNASGRQNHGILIGRINEAYGGAAGPTFTTKGTGNMFLNGFAGNGNGSGYNVGVFDLVVGGINATGSGNITINGTGSSAGEGVGQGVQIQPGATVTANGGNVKITGTGGATSTTQGNDGIDILGTVSTVGNGTVTLTGTGGGQTDGNGVEIYTGGKVQTAAGKITINGTSSSDTDGVANNGVRVRTGGVVTTTAGGDIGITGTAKNSSGDNSIGVLVEGAVTGSGGAMVVNGTGGNGTGNFNDGVRVSGGSVTNVGAGGLSVTGIGGGTGNSHDDRGVYVLKGGKISTVNNLLTINGTAGGAGTGLAGIGNDIGVYLTDAGSSISNSGTGTIAITGFGGGNGGKSNNNHGVLIETNTSVAATGTGSINVAGTGGNASGDNNSGVYVNGSIIGNGNTVNVTGTGGSGSGDINNGIVAQGLISNIGSGAINMIGTGHGGATSSSKNGIAIYGTVSGVNGTITINGTDTVDANASATNLNHDNSGVYLSPGAIVKTTGAGNINVIGKAATGAGATALAQNVGVSLYGGTISAQGTGNVTVTGTGGNGNVGPSGDHGVKLNNASTISANGGALNITGTAGNGSLHNVGVYALANSTISNTGAGVINVNGTGGGAGSNNNYGIELDSSTVKSTGSGAITLTGTGGNGNGDYNYGVFASTASNVQATGTGAINIAGIGGNGTGNGNDGVYITGNVTNSGTGSVTLTGTGTGGSGSASQYGVAVVGGTVSTAAGALVVNGNLTNTNGTSATILPNDNAAVYVINGGTLKTSGAGNITVTGKGSPTGVSASALAQNIGVWLHGGFINALGTGNVTINGTGGTNPGGNHGVLIRSNGAVTANGGAIVINGTGGTGNSGTGDGANVGVYLLDGTVSNTGAGTITVNGTGGGDNASINNFGVAFDNGAITSTGTGTITVNAIGGGDKTAATNNIGLEFLNRTNTIGGATFSGDIHLNQDTMALPNGADNIQTTGTVYMTPLTDNTSIGIGNGAGTLFLTDFILGGVNASKLVIGDRTLTGSIDYKSGLTFAEKLWLLRADRNTGELAIETQINSTATGAGSIVVVSGGNFVNTAGVTPLNTPNGDSELYLSKKLLNGTLATNTLGGFTYGAPGDHFVQVQNTSFEADAPTELVDTLHWTNLATLTVTANNASKTYGDADPTFTKTVTGFAAGDTAANSLVETTPWWTVSCGNGVNCNSSNVGNYSLGVNLANLSSNNGYIIVAGPAATFTINKANLAIKANDLIGTYGSVGLPTYTATGLKLGQTVGSVTLTPSTGYSTSGNVNAGTGTIAASNATGGTFSASNYNITYTGGVINLAKKTLTTGGTITANNKTYDATTVATLNTAGATVSGQVAGDVVAFNAAGATGAFADKNVGNNKVVTVSGTSLSGADAANYSIAPFNLTANITPASLTIKANDKTSTYNDGSTLNGATDYTATGLVGGETVGSVSLADNATLSTGGHKNAGTWNITASNATGGTFSASNYAITYTGGLWTINKKTISTPPGTGVGSITANNKTYDGNTNATLNTAGATLSGIGSGDVVALNTAGATGTFSDKNAGNNKAVTVAGITITGADAANYSFVQPSGVTANILAAGLTIKANDKSSTYGDGATLNGSTGFTATGLVGGDTIGSVTLADNATLSTSGNKNAGTWAITASNATGGSFNAANYTINYTNGAWTIAKKTVTTPNTGVGSITANNKTYDGTTAATLNTAGATVSGLVAGDVVALNTAGATGTFDTKNVGTNKTVTVAGLALTGTDSANYSFVQPTGVKANITAANLLIKANDKSSTYGDGATLNGSTGFTATGLVAGETVGSVTLADNATLSTSGNKNAGTWAITASNATGGTFAASNYNITYTNGAWTIAKKIVTTPNTGVGSITANNKTYDGNTNATLNTAGATISGIVTGDVVALNTAGATGTFNTKDVGTAKPVTVAGITISGTDAANYSFIQPANVKADITAANLIIKANDKSSTYGDGSVLGSTGYTATGLVGGETIGSVTLADNATLSTSGNKNAGTWVITASNATGGTFNASNYAISYTNGTWTIAKKVLNTNGSITANNKTYDATTTATLNTAGASVTGQIAGDVVAFNTAGATGTFADKNVGNNKTVTVSGTALSGADAGNYTIAPFTLAANITPASLTLKANDKSSTYGDGAVLNGTTGFTATGLQGGETVGSVTLADNATTSTSGNKSAGTWVITASNATGGTFAASNYTINYTNGAWTIAKKDISTPNTGVGSITANNKTYDGNTNATLNTAGATLSGIVGTDVVAINTAGATGTFNDKNVGTAKPVTVAGITISGTDAANYNFIQPANVKADITAATLIIKANNKSSTYGDGSVLDGTTGFTATGLASGESIGSVTLSTNATNSTSGNKNAGTWNIAASNATGGTFAASNYAISYQNGTWTIAQKVLNTNGSITANNKTYDATTTATLNTAGASVTGQIAGDIVAFNTAGATGSFADKNVGNNKAVTVTGTALTGADAGNYTIAPLNLTANITPASLVIKANDKSSTYDDGSTLNGTTGFTATGLQGGETVGSVTLADNATLSTGGHKNAGTWAITASNAAGGTFSASNYAITYTNGAWTIAKKTVSTPPGTGVGSITAQNKSYDGNTNATLNTAGATISGIATGDVVALNTAGATGTFDTKNVGTAKPVTVAGITISGTDAANYSFVQPTGVTANITAASLIIKANDKTSTYDDGSTLNGATDYTATGLAAGETIGSVTLADNATLSTGGHKNAGTWVITASNATGGTFDASNYAITYTNGAWTINKKTISTPPGTGVGSITAQNKAYDGTTAATLNTAGATLSGIGSGDVVAINTTGATGTFDTKNVGTNKAVTVAGITISGTDAANYSFVQPSGVTANITAASLTVKANDKTSTYADGATLNGTTGFTATGLAAGETIGSVTLADNATTSPSGNKNAGTWAITASNATGGTFDASNYSINYVGGTWVIDKKTVTTTPGTGIGSITAQNKTYDGNTNATLNTAGATIAGIAAGDVVALDTTGATGTFDTKNAGTNKAVTVAGITITGAQASNYSFVQPANVKADITGAALNIKANDKTSTYADGATLNGTTGFTATGLVGTETVGSVTLADNATLSTSGQKEAGTWAITASNATGGTFDAANYVITYTNGAWDIGKKNISTPPGTGVGSITAQNKVYDGTTAATLNTAGATLSGINGTDVVAMNTAGATGTFDDKNAGTGKNVTVAGITLTGTDASNYNFVSPTGVTADITQRALTVSATGGNKTYDGSTDASGIVTLSDDRVAGDILNDTFGSATFADKNAGVNKPITVTGINVFGTDAGNYTYNTTASTTGTINKAALAVVADNVTGPVGGPIPSLTYSYSGLVGGDTGSVFSGGLATNATNASPAGSYDITLGTLTAGINYAINFSGGTNALTLTGSGPSFSLGNSQRVYVDATPPAPTVLSYAGVLIPAGQQAPQFGTALTANVSMLGSGAVATNSLNNLTPAAGGNLGNLSPSAGGNLGDLAPAAGDDTAGLSANTCINTYLDNPLKNDCRRDSGI